MSSSDIEMVDSSHSESELPQQLVEIDVTVAAAYKPGPQRLTYKGKQYIWKYHEDNCRAFTKPSVIWQLGDEYRGTGSDQETSCGLCKTTTLLAMTDAMSAECERVFSSTKKLITPERNRLAEEIIEASKCLKNWWDRG